MAHTTQETLTSAIHESVARAAKDLQEEYIREATEIFEARLRHQIAITTMQLASFYDVERNGANLRITVRMGGTGEQP